VLSKLTTCSFDCKYERGRTYVSMLTITGNDPISEMMRRERYEMKERSYLAADLGLATAGELRSVMT
jgi:hypothetical protein